MSLQNSHQISDVKVMLVKGVDGKGIASIEKTGTQGLVDTYTINFTDGTKTTFTVTNGAGGGMSALLLMTSEAGSEISVTSPSGRSLVVTQVSGSSTIWQCETTEYGVHTISSVLSGETATASVDVDTCKIYNISALHFSASITVSYPEGATCTCTKEGGSPVTALSNPYTFVVGSAGNYTITVLANGETYTSTVSITTNGQTETLTMPVGSTVTPTDSIPTLLACAGIVDENITTLSELLADTTTLQAVISSNNAIDYLVRSTSFAKSEALVPTMTSDNTPSGTAFANPENSTYPAWKAFDNNNTTYAGFTNTVGNDIGYTFLTKTKVAKLLLSSTYTNTNIFTIQGSDDGVTYTDIKDFTATGQAVDNSPTSQTETFNLSEYLSFKIKLKTKVAEYGGASINTLQFYTEDGFTDNSTAMSYIGLNNYASNTLLADSTWNNAIQTSQYFESVLNLKNPTMTSNNTPSGVCFGSNAGDGTDYYYAFDGSESTNWRTSATVSGSNLYVGYKFPQKAKIYMAVLLFDGGINSISYKIQGSDDDFSSDVTDLTSNLSGYSGKQTINISGDKQSYRLYINSQTTPAGHNLGKVADLRFYGRADV